MDPKSIPNPAWKPVDEGDDVGGGFQVVNGKMRWFRLICRGGQIVEEDIPSPLEEPEQ